MTRLVTIWDIDGTVANNDHRASLLEKRCSICLHQPLPYPHRAVCPTCGSTDSTVTDESWEAFLNPELMAHDTPYPNALKVLSKLREQSAVIHFLTARNGCCREVTNDWLVSRAGKTEKETLYMRHPEDEDIPASIYKGRGIERIKKDIGSEGVFVFFEDDPHIFPVHAKHGLVIRCPDGLEHFSPESPSFPEYGRRA